VLTALEVAERRAAVVAPPVNTPFRPPALFRYTAPVSRSTLAHWQEQLDEITPPAEHRSRLLVRWEPGDRWQPIQRFLIWIAQDPRFVKTEPWLVAQIKKGSPRATGHYCGEGDNEWGKPYCYCEVKKNRWVLASSNGSPGRALIDRHTWALYQETGLYGWRWWTIQGRQGGHRFMWGADELAPKLSQMKGGPADTPAAGDLPYAPFDGRVIRAIVMERRAGEIIAGLESARDNKTVLDQEDNERAAQAMDALMQWTDERAYALWHDGAELLPRFLEEKYGRVPVHIKPMDAEALEAGLRS
jgi:hypothetical protein